VSTYHAAVHVPNPDFKHLQLKIGTLLTLVLRNFDAIVGLPTPFSLRFYELEDSDRQTSKGPHNKLIAQQVADYSISRKYRNSSYDLRVFFPLI